VRGPKGASEMRSSTIAARRCPGRKLRGGLAWLLVLWLGTAGPLWAGEVGAALRNLEIQRRSTNEFYAADFFKPVEPVDPGLDFKLAPMILQEVKGDSDGGKVGQEGRGGGSEIRPLARDAFGSLSLSNGIVVFDRSAAAVYVSSDTVEIGGKVLPRFSYVWFYGLGPAAAERAGKLLVQGVRLTLNAGGEPVVWEVMADPSGVEVMFVAQSLENAAAAAHGKALPGRRYAIERSVDEVPNVVVARVIDDGPLAMGPMVYLSAPRRAVSTVICRCMPAQARKLLATTAYELRSGADGSVALLLAGARGRVGAKLAFWPGEGGGDRRLEKCLRLPEEF